jgi:uncharacterized repeat protein (TIGR03803 family)
MKSKTLRFFLVFILIPFSVFSQSKIWGITNKGGSGTIGTVYSTDNDGSNQLLLNEFVANYAGSKPTGNLIEVSNKLYGFTSEGGTSNKGVLFSFDINTQQYTLLFNFDGALNGATPKGSLMLANNGLLYGVTSKGGLNDGGVLFSFDINTSTFTKLHDFTFASGIEPDGALVEQTIGELYGVTFRGGVSDKGVLFRFTIAGNNYQNLYNFNALNGENPRGTLLKTPNGYLMGLTSNGGVNSKGVVFGYRVSTSTFTKHVDFSAVVGGNPEGSLVFHPITGKCYGLAANDGVNSQGTLFQVDTNGTAFLKIYDFQQLTGGHPKGTLTLAGSSKLLGNTYDGGPANYGVAFTINTNGSNYNASGIYDFFGVGANPTGGFVDYTFQGKYYCLTSNGGNTSNGMLVSVDTANFNLTAEFSFNDAGIDGGFPVGGIIKGSSGKVYGTTSKGGANGTGTAFQLDANGSNFLKMADFNGTNGDDSRGSLIETANGKFIGMTFDGGSFNFGCIYEIDPALPFPSTPIQKLALSSGLGTYPRGGIIKANNGKYYGLTSSGGVNNDGVLFEYNPNNNNYVKRYEFSSLISGSAPVGNLIQAANGNLYGYTSSGGANGGGVIFKYNPLDSSFTKIHDFTNASGISPEGTMCYNPANGLLYGMTKLGGTNARGVLFSINPLNNTYAALFNFGLTNGDYPIGKLVLSDNGKLYGTTEFGGVNDLGVFFEFTTGANTFLKLFDFSSVNGAKAPSELLLMNCAEPLITAQPINVNSCPNNNVSFSLTASGTGLSYQWYKNGVIIAGATSATLNLSNVTILDNGNYHCIINNQCGFVLTQFAKLSIVSKPASSITRFGPAIFCDGNFNTELSIAFNPLHTYQWNLNSTPIAGATTNLYNPIQTGNYTLTVSSGVGCDSTSVPEAITVVANITGTPNINVIPSTNLICGPTSITFDADTTLVGINPYCEWKKNGFLVSNGINFLTYTGIVQNNDQITVEIIPNFCPSNVIYSDTLIMIDTCAAGVINIDSLSSNSFCAGQSALVYYHSSSSFLPGNILSVQLSDANGSFASPTTIGTLITVTAIGSINVTIPATAVGTGYRMRVNASLPLNTGNDNGVDLYVSVQDFNLSYVITPAAPLVVQPFNASFQNTTPNASLYNFNWHFGDGTFINNAALNYTHTYQNNGVYQTALVATDLVSGCSQTLYDQNNSNHKVICNDPNANSCTQPVLVTPNGLINSCVGGSILLSCNQAPNYTYQWSRNGVLMPGENTFQLQVTQAGFYTVIVYLNGACPVVSNPVQINFNNPTPAAPTITFNSGASNNCGNSNGTLTAAGAFPSFIWSTGQTGQSININTAGTYTVIGQGTQGCDAVSAPIVVTGQTIPIPEICTVTAIEDDLHHLVIWYKPVSAVIDSFIIMKDSLNNGNYIRAGAKAYAELSEFEDLNSNPPLGAATYRVIAKDTCGGLSQPSAPVRPMFLQVQANIGIQRWLNWNQYISQTQNINTYVIYRGVDILNLDSITSINAPANGYLDFPPGLNFVYRVEAILQNECEGTRAARRGSISNGTGNFAPGTPDGIKQVGFDAFDFSIMPNPNNGVFTVVTNTTLHKANNIIRVYDIIGNEVHTSTLQNNKVMQLNLSHLSSGVYLVRYSDGNLVVNRRLVVAK